jgi:hypothetical protein
MAKFSFFVMWLNVVIGMFGMFIFIILIGSAGEVHWTNFLCSLSNFAIAYVLHKQQS